MLGQSWGGSRVCVFFLLGLVLLAADHDSDLPVQSGANLKVRLLSPLSTTFNRKGDMVSARILEPSSLQNGFLEGEIREVNDGGDWGKGSRIQFEFHTLHLPKQSIPISGFPVEVHNSRGAAGVDESGAAIDGLSHGAGSKSSPLSLFSHGSASFIRMGSKTAHLTFAAGSEWTIQIQVQKPH